MVEIEPLSLRLCAQFKTARLTALRDTPTAFGSTYAKESQLSDADWVRRVSAWNSNRSVCFLAMEENAACGIVAGRTDENDPHKAHLLSMWVAPTHRRASVGSRLVQAVEVWAKNLGIHELQLMVTSQNRAAKSFYERLGFTRTGRTEPYPNDPALIEYEMAKSLQR